jgi:hypothetical protein
MVSQQQHQQPIMVKPKRRYQEQRIMDYWQQRGGQVGPEKVYKGSSTYMMQQVGTLRYCIMRQRARKVKLMLDWGAHGRRMQLMGLEESGICPIFMETDLLKHIAFNCLHSAALHQRQTWVNGIQAILHNQGRNWDHKTWRMDNA